MANTKVSDPKLFATIRKFMTVYLPKIRSRSEHTIRSYQDSVNLFMEFMELKKGKDMEHIAAADFSQENILEYLDWIKTERGCSDTTRNQRLVCIRAFCKYLHSSDVVTFSEYARIKEIETIPTVDRTLSELLSLEQIRMLLSLPDKRKPLGLRDHFFIALLYDTGCRNEEIIMMKTGDILKHKDGSGEVGIVGKGRKYRVTPISSEVMAFYDKYATQFHPDLNPAKMVFYTTYKQITGPMSEDNSARILRKYEDIARRKEPELPHLHPHLFRHCRAMHLYQAGTPLSLVGEWLGHSQLETTLIYAYADTEMKRKAADKVQDANGSVFKSETFKYKNNKEALKKLFGLA